MEADKLQIQQSKNTTTWKEETKKHKTNNTEFPTEKSE